MIYLTGTKLTCRETGVDFVVTESDATVTKYCNATHRGHCLTDSVAATFDADASPIYSEGAPGVTDYGTGPGQVCEDIAGNIPPPSALDTQVGGEHYKTLGEYQPWEVLRRWLTPEEFRGYMKGTAIAYLARERQKGGDQDIEKACHTLQGLIELMGGD